MSSAVTAPIGTLQGLNDQWFGSSGSIKHAQGSYWANVPMVHIKTASFEGDVELDTISRTYFSSLSTSMDRTERLHGYDIRGKLITLYEESDQNWTDSLNGDCLLVQLIRQIVSYLFSGFFRQSIMVREDKADISRLVQDVIEDDSSSSNLVSAAAYISHIDNSVASSCKDLMTKTWAIISTSSTRTHVADWNHVKALFDKDLGTPVI